MKRFLGGVAAVGLALSIVAAPAQAHHCAYSGSGWLCSGGDPTDPYHLNDPATPSRIAGESRYATAAAVSASFWQPGEATTVYIANGQTFADAVSAGPSVDGPILLVPTGDTVPAVTLAEIERLAPVTIVGIGGPSAVSDAQLAAAQTAGQ